MLVLSTCAYLPIPSATCPHKSESTRTTTIREGRAAGERGGGGGGGGPCCGGCSRCCDCSRIRERSAAIRVRGRAALPWRGPRAGREEEAACARACVSPPRRARGGLVFCFVSAQASCARDRSRSGIIYARVGVALWQQPRLAGWLTNIPKRGRRSRFGFSLRDLSKSATIAENMLVKVALDLVGLFGTC